MAFSGNLLTINGSAVTGLKSYNVEYAKLWKDADRSMNGTISASLIGVFTKLKLQFRAGLSEDDIATLCGIFNTAYFSATYYDLQSKATKTEQFYASDFNVTMLSKTLSLYDEFEVTLVGVAKR